MDKSEVNEPSSNASNVAVSTSKGVFLTTKILILIGVVTALVFAGSICATYFGKNCKDCDKELFSDCNNAYCKNKTLINGKVKLVFNPKIKVK